jgi:hypothetical protein
MAEETKKTYTIRLPEQLVGRVEAQAASVNVTPTTLLQSLIAQHFDDAGQGGPDTAPLVALGGKLEELRKLYERLEQAPPASGRAEWLHWRLKRPKPMI